MTQFADVSYEATLAQTEFVIPFDYVKGSHLTLQLDGVSSSGFTVLGSTLTYTGASLNAGTIVRIRRQTPLEETSQVIDFTAGAILTEASVETSRRQLLHIIQEQDDTAKGQPRGMVRLVGATVFADQTATWSEASTSRHDAEGTSVWELDNGDPARAFELVGGNIRLGAGKWRVDVELRFRRSSGAEAPVAWELRNDVSGASGLLFLEGETFNMPDGRCGASGTVEVDLDLTRNLRVFAREDAASSGVTLDEGSWIRIERVD